MSKSRLAGMIGLVAVVVVLGAAMLVGGCQPKAIPAAQHLPTTPDQVKIYQTAPSAEFEELGTVQLPITPELRWDEHGDANAAFDQLKAKAAALGANGLLLEMPAEKNKTILTEAGYHGEWYHLSMADKTVYAKAIFVHQ
jgi:hypothetical protein